MVLRMGMRVLVRSGGKSRETRGGTREGVRTCSGISSPFGFASLTSAGSPSPSSAVSFTLFALCFLFLFLFLPFFFASAGPIERVY
jgi:hypothetical protein